MKFQNALYDTRNILIKYFPECPNTLASHSVFHHFARASKYWDEWKLGLDGPSLVSCSFWRLASPPSRQEEETPRLPGNGSAAHEVNERFTYSGKMLFAGLPG